MERADRSSSPRRTLSLTSIFSPVLLLILLIAWLLLVVAPAAGDDLFFDDFESYPAGSLPPAGEIVYTGKGARHWPPISCAPSSTRWRITWPRVFFSSPRVTGSSGWRS